MLKLDNSWDKEWLCDQSYYTIYLNSLNFIKMYGGRICFN